MAARKSTGRKVLASNVWVGDPAVLFMAGSTPPKEYADLITNPNAWADGEADDGDDEGDA